MQGSVFIYSFWRLPDLALRLPVKLDAWVLAITHFMQDFNQDFGQEPRGTHENGSQLCKPWPLSDIFCSNLNLALSVEDSLMRVRCVTEAK